MKLKKIYLPDPAAPLAAVVFLPMGTFVLYVGFAILVETLNIFDGLFIQSTLGAVLLLLFAAVFLLLTAAFFLLTVLGLLLACSPVKFTEEGIEQGLIRKELLLWSEVTVMCLAPPLAGGKSRLPDNTMCIASGDFSNQYLHSRGALSVHFAMILYRFSPWLGEKFLKMLGAEDCRLPEKMVWLYASKEVIGCLPQMWKEKTGEVSPES